MIAKPFLPKSEFSSALAWVSHSKKDFFVHSFPALLGDEGTGVPKNRSHPQIGVENDESELRVWTFKQF